MEEAEGIWAPVRNDHGDIDDFVLRYANPSFDRHTPHGTLASQIGAEVDMVSVARTGFKDGSSRPSRVVVSAHDITDISKHAAELEWLATHKRQTSLLNLDGFVPVVHERTLAAGGSFALIWLSLSELDTIGPTFGFAAGDAALVGAAGRMAVIAEQYGAIAAQPEDSALALLTPHVASGAEVQRIANGMRVCAEGVETEEELEAVARLGCDYVQGFLLGRPMSIANLLARDD